MRRKFIIIVLFQALLLFCIIAYRQYWIANGERVLLGTETFDARDIFRGDYVTLNYDISRLDLRALGTADKFRPRERVYVALAKGSDDIYRAASVSKTPPAEGKFIQGRAGADEELSEWEVFLRDDAGRVRSFRPRWFSGVERGTRATFCIGENNAVLHFYKEDGARKQKCSRGESVSGVISDIRETKTRQLRVDYGIESYFVEEGKGRAMEALRNAKNLQVEVSLRRDGKGIVTGLFLDGKLLR